MKFMFDRPFLGHHHYTLSLSYLCPAGVGEQKSLRRSTRHVVAPYHTNPAQGIMKFSNLVDPWSLLTDT